MLEIDKKQLLSFDNANRVRILKYIALGLIKYKGEWVQMSLLTIKTRRESNEKTNKDRPILYTRVLAILSTGLTLTANEIAKRINKNWKRQDIQPRLNELRDKYNLIEENGKKYDNETNRNVTAYRLIKENENHIPRID